MELFMPAFTLFHLIKCKKISNKLVLKMKNYKYHKHGIVYFLRTAYLCNINYDKVLIFR